MSSFALDIDGDLKVENNSLSLTTGKEAIRQHLQARFQTFLGEWFLDTDVGVPYYTDILIKRPSFAVVAEVLKSVILETPGVTELLEFSLDYEEKRTLQLEFKCDTIEGEVDFTQQVEV